MTLFQRFLCLFTPIIILIPSIKTAANVADKQDRSIEIGVPGDTGDKGGSMITLLILVALAVSIAVSKSQPRLAGAIDLGVAALLLFFFVIPGRADILDWIFMFLFFVGGSVFAFGSKLGITT